MSSLAVETGRLALIIGKVRQTCFEEALAMEKLLRELGPEEEINVAWSLSAVEAALFDSVRRVWGVSEHYLDLRQYPEPELWYPELEVKDTEHLLDAWLQEMHRRVDVLGELYNQARQIMFSLEVGEEEMGDLHLDIDGLKDD